MADNNAETTPVESNDAELPYDQWEQRRNQELMGEGPTTEESAGAEHATVDEGSTEAPAAESAEEPDDSEASEEQEPPKKKRGGYQKKIDKLKTENAALAERVAKLERGLAAKPADADAGGKPAEKAAAVDGKPKQADFEDYDDYVDALTDWKLEQREKARLEAEAKTRTDADRKAALDKYVAREAAVRAAIPDYDEVLEEGDIAIPAHMHQALIEAERGPELVYHLAKNPAEAERIAKLGPLAAARELGKLEAALPKNKPGEPALKEKERPKKATSAPRPVTPVTGGSGTARSMDDPDIPYEEWERRRNEQLLRRGR